MKRLIPLSDRIVVRQVDAKEMTDGGIVLPDSAKEKPREGVVVSIGPGKRDPYGKHMQPLEVDTCHYEEGSTVLFGMYAGTEIEINDETLLILGEDDILAVIEDE